jgi:hypothetical protein
MVIINTLKKFYVKNNFKYFFRRALREIKTINIFHIFENYLFCTMVITWRSLYHSFLLTKDLKQFVEQGMPKIWTTLYDESVLPQSWKTTLLMSKLPKSR